MPTGKRRLRFGSTAYSLSPTTLAVATARKPPVHYGVSRPTGDKWIERYQIHGAEGLCERSRRPPGTPTPPHRRSPSRIVETKLAHQSFGPKPVMDPGLRALEPDQVWPAEARPEKAEMIWCGQDASFRRFGRRSKAPAHDFKGDVPLAKSGYPLTLTTNILQCRALNTTTTDAVKPWFEWVFREYGLPETLPPTSPPFASVAAGGLSQLSKWWIRLGIRLPDRTG